jgi:deferrochelatase/peroxidase EfeB
VLRFPPNDADGNPVTPANAHVRLTPPATNEGAQVLRRGYSYDNALSLTAERCPPGAAQGGFIGQPLFGDGLSPAKVLGFA